MEAPGAVRAPSTSSEGRSNRLQFLGVCRHAERADDLGALVEGLPWCLLEDSKHWPYDPPLSDAGLRSARELGLKFRKMLHELDADLHVVITSPFLRCVQTAAMICQHFGRGTKLLIDNSLVEIYGPCIMGDEEPQQPDVREVSLQSPIEQLDRAAAAAVRRLKAFHPIDSEFEAAAVNSLQGFPQREHNVVRGRAAAYIRCEETRNAMWAKREWSGLQGLTQEEQVMMDVSDLGSERVAEDGIPLGEGWLLQISGIVMSGRRKSLGSKKDGGPREVRRDWGPAVLIPTEGSWWQEALSSLPQLPLGREEERRSSQRHSLASLELFASTETDFSTATCPRMSPRHTVDDEELEVFNLWTGQSLSPSPEHCLVVAPQTSLPGGPRRPSFLRRRSTPSNSTSEHLSGQESPAVVSSPRKSEGSTELTTSAETGSSSGSEVRSHRLVLPSLEKVKTNSEADASFDPDKSPLYQRRRRKAIMSNDSVNSIANLSTTDGSIY
eukprot:Skav211307  [mRNA]  locus=scaffold3605:28198:30375:+ [translate_table: standard]